MPETVPPRAEDGTRLIGLLALSATFVARGLSTALPGATAGIERWIETTSIVGAVLSQATVVVGVAASVGLLLATLWRRSLPWAYRSFALPSSTVVMTLVFLSARLPLEPSESRVLAISATLLAGLAAVTSLAAPRTRATALVVLGAALSGALHLAANWLAVEAVARGGYAALVATVAFVVDAAATLLAGAWLLAQRRRTLTWLAAAAVPVVLLLAWGAAAGSNDGASLWQVLASKAFAELATIPGPAVNIVLVYAVDALAFVLAALLLANPRESGVPPTAMALALLARANPDIPLCALMLTLSALLTALEASRRGKDTTARPPTVSTV